MDDRAKRLIPILSETSLQAQLVVPMAVSLAFGVLFATVITLVLIPCQYVALEDIKGLIRLGKEKKELSQSDIDDDATVKI